MFNILHSNFMVIFLFLIYLTGYRINFRLQWSHYRWDEKPSLPLACVEYFGDKASC